MMSMSVRKDPLSSELKSLIEDVAGEKVRQSTQVTGGFSPALRFIVEFETGQKNFVKISTNEFTRSGLLNEILMYKFFQEKDCTIAAKMHAATPHSGLEQQVLITENLEDASWPKNWSTETVKKVREGLEKMWDMNVPHLKKQSELFTNGWVDLASNPEPFLRLGLVKEQWLSDNINHLKEVDAKKEAEGSSLNHNDIRSDNLCFRSNGDVCFVDWGSAVTGNPKLDFGLWLPSLAAEGGSLPQELLPNSFNIAALVCGYFASRAGLPPIPNAPHVRSIQFTQLQTALPWLIHEIDKK